MDAVIGQNSSPIHRPTTHMHSYTDSVSQSFIQTHTHSHYRPTHHLIYLHDSFPMQTQTQSKDNGSTMAAVATLVGEALLLVLLLLLWLVLLFLATQSDVVLCCCVYICVLPCSCGQVDCLCV